MSDDCEREGLQRCQGCSAKLEALVRLSWQKGDPNMSKTSHKIRLQIKATIKAKQVGKIGIQIALEIWFEIQRGVCVSLTN